MPPRPSSSARSSTSSTRSCPASWGSSASGSASGPCGCGWNARGTSREAVGAGEIDAAIVFDSRRTPPGEELGAAAARLVGRRGPSRSAVPDPLPLVAYDPPCGLRELAAARLEKLGIDYEVVAESPHLFGVQAAARQGLGYALLSEGGDGLRRVGDGPLAEPIEARLLLLGATALPDLAQAIRATVWRATARLGAAA